MAGLYIHIPFCRKKCVYCNFYSIANLNQKERLVGALKAEIGFRQDFIDKEIIETIYIGGGTPSLLDISQIEELIGQARGYFNISRNPEITLEANPDDLDKKYLNQLSNSSVNRLSIGIQSFFDDDLKYLRRIHTADQGLNSVLMARDAGFSNLSIDLIYGIPGLTNHIWKENIEKAVALQIPHISCYSLTSEPGTPLPKLINSGKVAPLDEDQSVLHFQTLIDELTKNNYLHYEISNFCLPGSFAAHNTNYWRGIKYLGIGPSAHSYNGAIRTWNVSSVDKYIHQIESGVFEPESEVLCLSDKFNEYVMTSLRTMWGADANFIETNFGTGYRIHFLNLVHEFVEKGFIKESGFVYLLTDSGKLFADKIASDLFVVDH